MNFPMSQLSVCSFESQHKNNSINILELQFVFNAHHSCFPNIQQQYQDNQFSIIQIGFQLPGSQNQTLYSFKLNSMQTQSIQQFVTSCLQDHSQLLQAHSSIAHRLQRDIQALADAQPLESTFLNSWIQFIGEETEAKAQFFQAVTIFHSSVVEYFPKFPQSLQDHVRTGLLNAVISRNNNLRTIGALGLLIREIVEKDHQNDGFKQWIQPLEEVIKWMSSEQPGTAASGVQFFIAFYKQTAFTSTNTELPLYKISSLILPSLFQVFTNAPQQYNKLVSLRQKILYLVLQVFKTFAYLDGYEDDKVKQCIDSSFQLWMSLMLSVLKGPINKHLRIKKYIIKILIIVYRDLTSFCSQRLANCTTELITAWEFTYKLCPYYLATHIWKQKVFEGEPIARQFPNYYFDDEADSNLQASEALSHCSVELISVIATSNLFSLTVRLSLHHIVNILFHYYIITREQLSTWTYNYLYFLGAPEHQSLRGKILNILNELIERNTDYAIQTILLIAEKFLVNHPQSHTIQIAEKILNSMNINEVFESGKVELKIDREDLNRFIKISGCDARQTLAVKGQTWRKSEVALSILGRFSEDIIVFQSKQQGIFDIESFVKGLMKQFESDDHNIETFTLKGQSLYCLTRFTEIISIKYRNLFSELVTSCSVCTQQVYPDAVRLAACKIITIFLRKIQKHGLSLTQQQIKFIESNQVVDGIITLYPTSDTNIYPLEAIIEIIKILGHQMLSQETLPYYILDNINRNITHPSVLKTCFILLELLCSKAASYKKLIVEKEKDGSPILTFIYDCLDTYSNIIKSQQKKYLKSLDTELIVTILKVGNIVILKCPSDETLIHKKMLQIIPLLKEIIENNEDIPIHIGATICLKSMIRVCPAFLKQNGCVQYFVDSIHLLLKIPNDKAFQAASVYVGNLIILTFDCLLDKPNQEILQEVVLKVFRSRTPSVIQSLILTYSRLINSAMNESKPFNTSDWQTKVRNIIDFLSSFSIENRMGLKILVDKWLLQQSLFRGKYTKISTFMALSKLFLLRDKRIDNLLVIGFNPSHTNVNNDVNAPLKILATLIRCFHNQMGDDKDEKSDFEDEQQNDQIKNQQDKGLDVALEKFKDEEGPKQQVGGLADRQNQQGSTCYMSAMLEFYDDGEECDETTQQDLSFLKDISTSFQLKEYLNDFFVYLNEDTNPYHSYFKECLKELLKEDIKNLQKHIKICL